MSIVMENGKLLDKGTHVSIPVCAVEAASARELRAFRDAVKAREEAKVNEFVEKLSALQVGIWSWHDVASAPTAVSLVSCSTLPHCVCPTERNGRGQEGHIQHDHIRPQCTAGAADRTAHRQESAS